MEVSFRGYEGVTVRTVQIGKGAAKRKGYAVSGNFNNIGQQHLEKFTNEGFFELFERSPNLKSHFRMVFADGEFISLNGKKVKDMPKDNNLWKKPDDFFDSFTEWFVTHLEKKGPLTRRNYNITQTCGKDSSNSIHNFVVNYPRPPRGVRPEDYKPVEGL